MNSCMPTNFDNLEEIYNFTETYSLPKLNQEEVDQLNRLMTRNEIEYVIKHSLQIKVQDQMASQENSTKYKIYTQPPKFVQKFQEGSFPKTFHDATITLIPKPDKDTTKK